MPAAYRHVDCPACGHHFVTKRANPLDETKVAERFWAKVMPEPNTGCYLWTGSRQGKKSAYGVLTVRGVTIAAHRFA